MVKACFSENKKAVYDSVGILDKSKNVKLHGKACLSDWVFLRRKVKNAVRYDTLDALQQFKKKK